MTYCIGSIGVSAEVVLLQAEPNQMENCGVSFSLWIFGTLITLDIVSFAALNKIWTMPTHFYNIEIYAQISSVTVQMISRPSHYL